MILTLNNHRDEVLRRLTLAIWTAVAIAFFLLIAIYSQKALASFSTDNNAIVIDHHSLDPDNRVALQILADEEQARQQKLAIERSNSHKRLTTVYAEYKKPHDLGLVFDQTAKKYGLSAKMVISVCVTESHFREWVRSKSGAVGMCQIIPRYHGTTAKAMLDYRKNIDKAGEILADYLQQCKGSTRCAIQAYNVGITAYKSGSRSPKYLANVRKEMSKRVDPS